MRLGGARSGAMAKATKGAKQRGPKTAAAKTAAAKTAKTVPRVKAAEPLGRAMQRVIEGEAGSDEVGVRLVLPGWDATLVWHSDGEVLIAGPELERLMGAPGAIAKIARAERWSATASLDGVSHLNEQACAEVLAFTGGRTALYGTRAMASIFALARGQVQRLRGGLRGGAAGHGARGESRAEGQGRHVASLDQVRAALSSKAQWSPDGVAVNRAARDLETLGAMLKTLDDTGWNRAEAARRMGIPRRTFYRRMKTYGLDEGSLSSD
ncbi:MAG: helix-turn-helix domain-containing protein [Myxococcales bacterium]|nr:helix-turn-helix domain-containing protein [Myxococcales bacterium]